MLLNPFIVLGGRGTLKHLKKLGFQTFPELFDESYDSIINHTDRLLAVVDSVEKACKIDDKEFHDIYCREIIPKVYHNRKLASSKGLKQKIWKKFILQLLDL